MSHKMKNVSYPEITCEKYLNRLMRQEKYSVKKTGYQEKLSTLAKPPMPNVNQRPRPRLSVGQQGPFPKQASQIIPIVLHREEQQHGDTITSPKESFKHHKTRHRSASENRDREPWSQILSSNRSKEKVSSFSTFDPLRTLHFLSKELHFKLQDVLPEENDVMQMVLDIQHALKRIPPEVAYLIHADQPDSPPVKTASKTSKSSGQEEKSERPSKPTKLHKICQTPPTLYQDDTEKFQKIMEENTYRLEASCKQLEIVCTNLQSEKEMTEKELEDARENVEFLCKRVKDLECEMEEISDMKIKQLEEEKAQLQQQLRQALEELKDNPTMKHLRKLVEELKKQKMHSDETCTRLEYDMTLLNMEKEKFIMMLNVRDREIRDIQEEMARIQEHVNKELKKLNGEVLSRVHSMKSLTEPIGALHEKDFIESGDGTISSITTAESSVREITFKESPCGDGEVPESVKEAQDAQKHGHFQTSNVDANSPANNGQDAVLEELLKGLTPSCKALLSPFSF